MKTFTTAQAERNYR